MATPEPDGPARPVAGNVEALAGLPPRSVRRVLERAQMARQRAELGESIQIPYITLHLQSGRQVGGWLLALGDDDHAGQAVLQVDRDGQATATDVLYVPLERIEAVMVHDAQQIADVLSDGRIPRPPPEPLSRLQAGRQAAHHADRLAGRHGLNLSLEVDFGSAEPVSLPAVGPALAAIAAAFASLAQDAFSRNVVRRAVLRVVLAQGEFGARLLEGGTLRLTAPLTGLDPRLTAQTFRELIAQTL